MVKIRAEVCRYAGVDVAEEVAMEGSGCLGEESKRFKDDV